MLIDSQILVRRKNEFLYQFGFFVDVIRRIFTFNRDKNIGLIVLVRQILYTGYEALGIISLIAFAIGGIIIIEGNSILPGFASSKIFYTILISVVTRELSCLLTAFIIIARSGTAISTELGNMVVNHEIDALQSIGISPVSYLVVPRVIGVLVSLITLTAYFNAAAVFGAWFIGLFFAPLNLSDYLMSVFNELTIGDLIASVAKTVVFGFAVAIISSFQGLSVNVASTEVPQRTIKAVVQSLTIIIIMDAVITAIFYIL